MRLIDKLLNRVTMYRLVVYSLGLLALLGILFAVRGRLPFDPTRMVVGLAALLLSNYLTDKFLGRAWRVARNQESWLVTSLILFLILPPPKSLAGVVILIAAGMIASASKFIVAFRGKHIFNPAAFAAVLLSLTALLPASWWVGNSALWPYSLVIGLLIVRKIRRFQLVFTFTAITIVLQLILFAAHHQPVAGGLNHALLSSPLIFLGTIMLTEPATMPPRKNRQLIFGALIAILYVTAWKVGPIYIYPEVALLIGNLYAYVVSPKFRVWLELKEIQKISERVYNYVFVPNRQFKFLPGQYMEWTLDSVPYDNRGNRRTFTIASSPTEDTVQVGLKYYDPPSMYKYAFSRLKPGDGLWASQLAGNFTLKGHEDRKLVFIAGGIGITPFRSMAKYIFDNKWQCDITLLYFVSDASELAYKDVFSAGAKLGLKSWAILPESAKPQAGLIRAKLSPELLAKTVPDYSERTFYISGPNAMVDSAKHVLRTLHVHPMHIRTDHFSGY